MECLHIDAKTVAVFATLSPQQAGFGLSRLHKTGYLAKVGSLDHYSLYIRTGKPLPSRPSSIERRYRHQLNAKPARYYMASPKEIARAVSHAVIATLRRELRRGALSSKPAETARQLTLFRNA
jgi:hypothetical protein